MPLSKTNELNLIMNENAKLTVEHSGGDGWTILHLSLIHIFNAMNAGEETAATMGVPVKWLKRISLGLVTLIASVTIAFSGVIGFIGLIAPHAARSMAGTDNRYLLPASGMMGAIVLLVSDTVSRTVLSPKEIPVGIITSLLGVPFFIYILSRRRKQMWG